MKTFLWFTSVVFLLAVLTGCRLSPDTATLVIENHASVSIDEVYLAPHGTSWIDDLCSGTIPPDGSREFRGLSPGTYDILVWDTEDGWGVWLGEVLEPSQMHVIVYPH